MGKPHRGEQAPQDSNAWITTYTDLMTLLLTFFVLLLSMAVIDSRKQREALNSLVGAFGFKPGGQSPLGKERGLNITMESAPVAREQVTFELLENAAFKNGLERDVTIHREPERLVISLSDRVLFGYQSNEISSRGRQFLSELIPVLTEVPGKIELRGYADPSETGLDADPFRKGMLLSAMRALAVYRFLKDEGKILPHKMAAHGFGVQTPRPRSGEIPGDLSRQVEIVLDHRAGVPQPLRQRQGDLEVDYRGFRFDFREGHGK
jgi:chemotaxis protein MotB